MSFEEAVQAAMRERYGTDERRKAIGLAFEVFVREFTRDEVEALPREEVDGVLNVLAGIAHARRSLAAAEAAHDRALLEAVRADVPGPWCVDQAGPYIGAGSVFVSLQWSTSGWTAYASSYPATWHKECLTLCYTPRDALTALRGRLEGCRGEHGRESLALVTRLLRGWARPEGG